MRTTAIVVLTYYFQLALHVQPGRGPDSFHPGRDQWHLFVVVVIVVALVIHATVDDLAQEAEEPEEAAQEAEGEAREEEAAEEEGGPGGEGAVRGAGVGRRRGQPRVRRLSRLAPRAVRHQVYLTFVFDFVVIFVKHDVFSSFRPCNHRFCEPCLRRLGSKNPMNTLCPMCRTRIAYCEKDKGIKI